MKGLGTVEGIEGGMGGLVVGGWGGVGGGGVVGVVVEVDWQVIITGCTDARTVP